MKQTNIFAMVFLVIGLSGCKMKLDELASVAALPPATIVGIWNTACTQDGPNSSIRSFQVVDGIMTLATIMYFGSDSCNEALMGATIMESGELTIGSDSASVTGAKNYEWKLTSAVVIPNSADIVTMLNGSSACSNIWELNVPGPVFGCSVAGDVDLTQVGFNTKNYGIFKIEAAATPNFLQFEEKCAVAGYYEICPTPTDRPTTLNGTVYFKN